MRRLTLLFALLFLISCNDKTPTGADSDLQITNITATPTTISVGSISLIRVETNKTDGLTHKWQSDLGYVIGSGNEVQFSASSCCVGNRTVTCTVQDKENNEVSKSVQVTVTP